MHRPACSRVVQRAWARSAICLLGRALGSPGVDGGEGEKDRREGEEASFDQDGEPYELTRFVMRGDMTGLLYDVPVK
jgi:hypothetical protein